MRAKLTVGPDGEIAMPARQAGSLGISAGGEVDLVLARGACALLVPVRPGRPSAWFAGSLASLTFPEIVQFLYSSLKTGLLLLAFRDARRKPGASGRPRRTSIYFKEGQIVFASSADRKDRLGPVLVGRGIVSEAELERSSRLVTTRRPLGQVLVDEGVITPGQLYEAITIQVKETFLDCFLETSGEFVFMEGAHDDQNLVKLSERTRDLILEGMKRLEQDELRRAGEGTEEPGADAGSEPFPFDGEGAAELEAETPAPGEGASAIDPPEVLPIEIELPVIEVDEPLLTPTPVAANASGPFETYRRIFKRVQSSLSAVDARAVERLNGWFDRLPDKRRAIFDGIRMGEDGEIDVASIVANVEATGAGEGAWARARALEALEEFLSFALFEAKNRLSRQDAQRLLREVGKMQMGRG